MTKNIKSILDVFSRLDISGAELKKVRKAVEEKDYTLAARNLLKYYRNRKTVKFFIDPKKRNKSRGRIASQEELKIARDALKHIFISQTSYPPHDFGKDIDWKNNIYPDLEWIVQLHRMYWWEPMGKAYWHTGKESFAGEWVFQFLDWEKKCPPSFENAWNTLNIGIRGYSFCWWYHYFRDSEAFTPEFLLKFLSSVYEHAVRLAARYTAGSNWGLMESEGLAYIAITFPEFKEAKEWREKAFERLSTEINNQVYPGGMQCELSFHYHMGCIKWFLRTADLAELNGIAMPGGYQKKIEKMYNVLAYSIKPDGTIPIFGDAWNESGLETIRAGAELYKRKDLAYISSLKDKKRRGREPSVTSIAFPDSGYYIFRSDWNRDAIWLCLKSGPDGKWHCQPDNCSFELFAYGSYLMPDSGCYIYHGDEKEREWFKATEHHQCFTLDNKNSAYNPELLLWHASPELTALTVQNQGYPDLAHRRNIFFIERKVFLIVDEIIGTANGKKQLHFQFGPPNAVFAKDGSIKVEGKGAGRLFFIPVDKDIEANKEPGQVAFKYRVKQKRSAVAYNLGDKSVFAALLIPYRGGKPPDCSVSVLSNSDGLVYKAGDNEMKFSIMIDNKRFTLLRNLKTKTNRCQVLQ
jgi:heparan-sulfate lyase